MSLPRAHAVIPTHTARHLRLTLLGLALQSPAPANVVVSIDNDRADVRDAALAASREFDLPLCMVHRSFPGEVRVGQVRNNGVRALMALDAPHRPLPHDLIYFVDGDSVAAPGLIARALEFIPKHELLIGGRMCLSEAQTAAFDEASLRARREPAAITPEQRSELRARQRRSHWHARLRPLGLAKAHKPKVLGASHGVRFDLYQRINGYDESFLGAWREDDDLGRRAYGAGARPRVALPDLCVYHLYHPDNPDKRVNFSELSPGGPIACAEGLSSPRPQAPLAAMLVHAGEITRTLTISG